MSTTPATTSTLIAQRLHRVHRRPHSGRCTPRASARTTVTASTATTSGSEPERQVVEEVDLPRQPHQPVAVERSAAHTEHRTGDGAEAGDQQAEPEEGAAQPPAWRPWWQHAQLGALVGDHQRQVGDQRHRRHQHDQRHGDEHHRLLEAKGEEQRPVELLPGAQVGAGGSAPAPPAPRSAASRSAAVTSRRSPGAGERLAAPRPAARCARRPRVRPLSKVPASGRLRMRGCGPSGVSVGRGDTTERLPAVQPQRAASALLM